MLAEKIEIDNCGEKLCLSVEHAFALDVWLRKMYTWAEQVSACQGVNKPPMTEGDHDGS